MTNDEYFKTIYVNGKEIKLGIDDYGQSYFIEYEEDGNIIEDGLGTYNRDYMEAIYLMFDDEYKALCRKQMYGDDMSEDEMRRYEEYLDIFSKEYRNESREV